MEAVDAAASRSSGGQPPPPGDRELVALACGPVATSPGDRAHAALRPADAFAELYRRHASDVHATITRRCGSAVVADDITAATFERALRNLRHFEWRDGGFRGWVFRIAVNELTDHYRREGAQRRRDARAVADHRLVELDPAAAIDDGADLDGRDTELLRAGLARLRPRHQEAITLRYLSGMNNDDAAAAMGTTRATFAVTVHRALRALERTLEDGR